MSRVDVAILGGAGAVGVGTLRALRRAMPELSLRLGGRRRELVARTCAAETGGTAEVVEVDLYDGSSLSSFCSGARIVVNCAGPSYQVLDRVAWAALAAGAHYVDPGGDEPVRDALLDNWPSDLSAVLTAGMMPGLTGLLPRWLARTHFDEPTSLRAYVGTMDRLTPAGAGDYLLSLGGAFGEARAAWIDGRKVAKALEPLPHARIPFYSRAVDAYPYLSYESQMTARALELDRLEWYNVFDGGAHMMQALTRLQGAMSGQSELAPAAEELTKAAALDLFGRDPYQLMVFEMAGVLAGEPAEQTLVLRGRDTYALTGFLAAMAVVELWEERVTGGVHFAAEILDGDRTVDALTTVPEVTRFQVMASMMGELAVEVGEL